MKTFTIEQARRIALDAQGFSRPRPSPRRVGLSDIESVVSKIKIIQIDPINVLVRAQYMPLFSRLGPYPTELLEEYAYRERRLFEYFAHEASYVPIEHLPLLRHRMDGWKPYTGWQRLLQKHSGIEDAIRKEIQDRGPLATSDIHNKGERYEHWGSSAAKIILETLLWRGELAIHDRVNGAKRYQHIEKVVPDRIWRQEPLDEEQARTEMFKLALQAIGIGTVTDIADYYRIKKTEAAPIIKRMTQSGQIEPVRIEGLNRDLYALPGTHADLPPISTRALLSPFDPLIWCRSRTEWLFDFFYRIEIYTPAKKRRYGYYVLPFLLDETIAARIDLKADRPKSVLRVPGAFLEDGQDPEKTASELAAELQTLASWLQLERIVVGRKGDFTEPLRAAVKSL